MLNSKTTGKGECGSYKSVMSWFRSWFMKGLVWIASGLLEMSASSIYYLNWFRTFFIMLISEYSLFFWFWAFCCTKQHFFSGCWLWSIFPVKLTLFIVSPLFYSTLDIVKFFCWVLNSPSILIMLLWFLLGDFPTVFVQAPICLLKI